MIEVSSIIYSQVIFFALLPFPGIVAAKSGWLAIFAGVPVNILAWLFSVAVAFRLRSST